MGDELYRNNPLDRGHLARRADLLWGSPAEARQANAESFYFTNIPPQHEGFNQSGAGGISALLEDRTMLSGALTLAGGGLLVGGLVPMRRRRQPRQDDSGESRNDEQP